MRAVFVQRGESVDFTPSRDVAAGEVLVFGGLPGVVKTAVKAGSLGALALTGVYDVEKDGLAVDYAAEISDELSRILGRRVHLNDGRKGGRIELEYYDADDREKLIDALRHLR